MRPRRALLCAALGAALTLGYAALVAPQWEPQHTDQVQYLSLARGLIERGAFTRAVDAEPFIPETYRLPGYPALLAPLCIGGCDHWRIAIMQAGLVALLVLATWVLARRLVPRRADLAALLAGVYLPFAYYGALALSDLAGAALVALGLIGWVRGHETRSPWWAVAAGAILGWAGLMRGALLFLPLALGALAIVRDRGALRLAIACVAAAVLVAAPYVAYSELSFGRASGGTAGLVLWLGYFQGRSEASLDGVERAAAVAARADIAAFDAMPDRKARALAWLALDDSLGARARALIARDPAGWMFRGVDRSFELWTGDRPVPGGAQGATALVMAIAQLVVVILGCFGALRVWKSDRLVGPIIALVIAYVWLTSLPFQTEGRYALPARAALLIGVVAMLDPRGHGTARALAVEHRVGP